ncbi:hypothetical protein PQX77_015909, partial [Marasmius sp. AFHP31]
MSGNAPVNPWAGDQGFEGQQGEFSMPPPQDNSAPDPETPIQLRLGDYRAMERAFEQMQKTVSEQRDLINQLTEQMIAINTAHAQPPPPPPPPPPPVTVSTSSNPGKPTFKEPIVFKDSVEDGIELQASMLPTPRHHCIYVAGYFGDAGRIWWRGIKNNNPALLDDFNAFKKAFRNHFGDKNLSYNAKLKIENLYQTSTAANYIARYKELVVYVDWSDASKIDQLYKNLKSETKDAVAIKSREERPTNFEDYCTYVISSDNRVQERSEERKHELKGTNGNNNNSKNDSVEDGIELQASMLPTPHHRCIYVAGYFGDAGRIWWRGIKNNNPALLDDFNAFKKAFRNHFGDKNLSYNAKLKIENLYQTTEERKHELKGTNGNNNNSKNGKSSNGHRNGNN